MIPTSAMVLAAGLGTRIRALDPETPKPLIKVAGKPLISYALDTLAAGGVKNFVVNVHHRADQMEDYLRTLSDKTIMISDEREQLMETGGGVIKARPMLGDAPFFCTNTDAILVGGDRPPAASLAEAWTDDMDALLLLVPRSATTGYTPKGDFSLTEDGRIADLDEDAPLVFTGLQILRPSLFDGAEVAPISTRAFWNIARERARMFGITFGGEWMHVGDPEGHQMAEARLA